MQHGEIRLGLHDVWMLLRPGWPGLAQRQGGLVSEAPAAPRATQLLPMASPSCLTPVPTVSVYKRAPSVGWRAGRGRRRPNEGRSASK